jgi:hypothetical protein
MGKTIQLGLKENFSQFILPVIVNAFAGRIEAPLLPSNFLIICGNPLWHQPGTITTLRF